MEHLVVGAGLIGGALAERLASRGDTVTVASRSGSAARGATPLVLDASDPAAFGRAAARAATIFVCTNPPYPEWAVQWPPIFSAAIAAATTSGADLVLMGNLYPYGPPTGPMTENSPETATEKKALIRGPDGGRRSRHTSEATFGPSKCGRATTSARAPTRPPTSVAHSSPRSRPQKPPGSSANRMPCTAGATFRTS